MRKCISCNKELSSDSRKDKIYCSKLCKSRRLYNKEYRIAHRDMIRIANRKWYLNGGKEKTSENRKKYKQENKDKIILRQKLYRINHPDKLKLTYWKYYINKDKNNIIKNRDKNYQLEYYHKNKSKALIRTALRKKLKDYIKNSQCQICGSKEKLQIHHWRYDLKNLFSILCLECHLAQHGKRSISQMKEMIYG